MYDNCSAQVNVATFFSRSFPPEHPGNDIGNVVIGNVDYSGDIEMFTMLVVMILATVMVRMVKMVMMMVIVITLLKSSYFDYRLI